MLIRPSWLPPEGELAAPKNLTAKALLPAGGGKGVGKGPSEAARPAQTPAQAVLAGAACPDDATPADKAIAFLETLKIPEGPKAGQPMRLARRGSQSRQAGWLLVSLPAAILPRPEPHRAGVLEAQSASAQARRAHLYRTVQRAPRQLRNGHAR